MSTENEGKDVPTAPAAAPDPEGSPAPAQEAPTPQAPTPEAPVPPPPASAPPASAPAPYGSAPALDEPAADSGMPATAAGAHGHSPQSGHAPDPASETPPAAYGGQTPPPWPPSPPTTLPSYGGGGGGDHTWGAPLPPPPAPPRRRTGGLVAAVLAAALVAGGVGGGIGYWAAERNDNSAGTTTVSAADSPRELRRDPGTVAAVANKALPSVVTIEAKSGGDDDLSGQGEGGTGTGFVYDKQGHILTNNHVVASAADGGALSATFSDGKTYDAEVVGRAQGYDVAVLKLKNAPPGLKPLPLGNSDKVAVGDSTIAIGAPFGLSNTVTTGIISAKNRPVASGDGTGGRNSYMSALQTDASINPGNSGGPLLDARGAVIGINSAIQSSGNGFGQSQAGSIGLGFAIPINQAQTVARQLIKTGEPVYAVIGATVDMTGRDTGARIADRGADGTPAVSPDGPAAKAGLKAGDVITGFDGKPVDSGPTLISEIWTHQPGDQVTLTYERDGKERKVTLTLGERKGDS
ncbi:S1C family serine protease [Streptomyces chengmaiensis]